MSTLKLCSCIEISSSNGAVSTHPRCQKMFALHSAQGSNAELPLQKDRYLLIVSTVMFSETLNCENNTANHRTKAGATRCFAACKNIKKQNHLPDTITKLLSIMTRCCRIATSEMRCLTCVVAQDSPPVHLQQI